MAAYHVFGITEAYNDCLNSVRALADEALDLRRAKQPFFTDACQYGWLPLHHFLRVVLPRGRSIGAHACLCGVGIWLLATGRANDISSVFAHTAPAGCRNTRVRTALSQ